MLEEVTHDTTKALEDVHLEGNSTKVVPPTAVPVESENSAATVQNETQQKKPEWKKNIIDKAQEIQKTISVAADVAKDKIQASLTIAHGSLTAASGIAHERIVGISQTTYTAAASKFGLLVSKGYTDFLHEDGSNEATIYAGSTTKIPFFVPKNTAIAWKVMVKGYDLGFLVRIREQADGGRNISIYLDSSPLMLCYIICT